VKRFLIPLAPLALAILAACGGSSSSAIPAPSLSPAKVTHASRIDACLSVNGNGNLADPALARNTLGCATGRGLFAVEQACAVHVAHLRLNSLATWKRKLTACW
jgi:hypothetical protein